MERVTGTKPLTCPWRAFNDPVVREVVFASDAYDKGNLATHWGDDPPAEWLDAMRVYTQAKVATRVHYTELDRKKREREHKR